MARSKCTLPRSMTPQGGKSCRDKPQQRRPSVSPERSTATTQAMSDDERSLSSASSFNSSESSFSSSEDEAFSSSSSDHECNSADEPVVPTNEVVKASRKKTHKADSQEDFRQDS